MRTERYAYRRRSWQLLAQAFDAVGTALVRPGGRRDPVSLPPRGRVLILRLDHLGDVLFATPALRALRAGLPEAHLTLLVRPEAAPLVRAGDLVDEVRSFPAPWFARPARRVALREWVALCRWMAAADFDAALDLRGDVRHLSCMALARVPVRLGYPRTGGGFWLSHAVPYRATHEVERNVDLVRVLVPAATAGELAAPAIEPAAAAWAEAVLRESGLDARRPLVLVHPGAGYPSKRWEAAALAHTLERCLAPGDLQAVLVGGPDDVPEALARRVAIPSLAGRTSLAGLRALLGRAAAYLGHDSGPSHLAVAAGVPSVLLYAGVNELAEWGPWGGVVRIFHAPVACSPCGLAVCNRAHECMRDLDPAAVAAAVRELAGVNRGA